MGGSIAPSLVGSLVLLSDQTLTGAATNITFSTIAGAYKHLQIIMQARGDGAVILDRLQMQFNGDTAGNYDWELLVSSNGTAQGLNTAAGTSVRAFGIPGASVTRASIAGAGIIQIPNYAGTTFEKTYTANGGFADSTAANQEATVTAGSWRNAAAITSIKLFPLTSTNFVAGSRATLYGLT